MVPGSVTAGPGGPGGSAAHAVVAPWRATRARGRPAPPGSPTPRTSRPRRARRGSSGRRLGVEAVPDVVPDPECAAGGAGHHRPRQQAEEVGSHAVEQEAWAPPLGEHAASRATAWTSSGRSRVPERRSRCTSARTSPPSGRPERDRAHAGGPRSPASRRERCRTARAAPAVGELQRRTAGSAAGRTAPALPVRPAPRPAPPGTGAGPAAGSAALARSSAADGPVHEPLGGGAQGVLHLDVVGVLLREPAAATRRRGTPGRRPSPWGLRPRPLPGPAGTAPVVDVLEQALSGAVAPPTMMIAPARTFWSSCDPTTASTGGSGCGLSATASPRPWTAVRIGPCGIGTG